MLGGAWTPLAREQRYQGSQLSSSDQTLTISEHIEFARTRLISLAGLSVAAGYFASLAVHLVSDSSASPGELRLLIAGGALGLASLALTRSVDRRAGALSLAVGLIAITSWQLLVYQLAYEILLAAYVGVLLVAIVGASPLEVRILTAVTVGTGLYGYLNLPGGPPSFQGALAIVGLLAGVGLALSRLQDDLLRAVGQLESSSARLQRLSHQDPLTGLGNRRLFDEQIDRQLPYSSPGRPLAMVMIDVDQLKSINDRHGHPAGDTALQAVAEAIRLSTRESDSAARIGGDEFGILLPTGGILGARRVAQRIHDHLQEWSHNGVGLTVSIGIAEATDPSQEVHALLHSADSDLYAGRRRVLAGGSSLD